MEAQVATTDRLLAEIASRQYGVVSLVQLRRLGMTKAMLQRRTRAGRTHRLHRGVHAVGHRALAPEGRWLAAVLAVGFLRCHQHRLPAPRSTC